MKHEEYALDDFILKKNEIKNIKRKWLHHVLYL